MSILKQFSTLNCATRGFVSSLGGFKAASNIQEMSLQGLTSLASPGYHTSEFRCCHMFLVPVVAAGIAAGG